MADPRPTMQDVAELAGVSLKTVSRVVNGEDAVTKRTYSRVIDAIAQLGYRRNDLASSLRRGVTSATIGLVIGDLANPFYSTIARAVEAKVRREGSLLITASSEEDPDLERELVSALLSRQVDGLLLVPAEGDHSWLVEDMQRGVQIVFVDRPARNVTGDTVVFDNAAGARLAVEHLVERGHRRIAVIADNPELFTARERLAGYEAALGAAGIDLDPDLVRSGVHDTAAAADVAAELMRLPEPPDALFAANNRITIGALGGMRTVDRFVSTVGFDEFELADLLGLTVVSGDAAALGRAAVDLLYARMAGDDGPAQHVALSPRLLVRRALWAGGDGRVGLHEGVAP